MNCLICPNYWRDSPDEPVCTACGGTKTLVDVLVEMPPLFMGKDYLVRGYHLRKREE